ncbi:MAG: diacylglycerol acyltransferase-domain-containing protein [Monoraphidium minutum]|nr:MAG: diacylglycerol acyltransferase-domain-containing protein [Monoraphidium minutum]
MPRRWWSVLGWEVVAVLALIGYMGIPLHLGIVFFRAATGDLAAALFGAAILVTLLMPAKPLMWPPFLECFLLKAIRQYFNFSVTIEAPAALGQRAIWAEYPHGVFPLSQLLAVSLDPRRWPGLRAHSVGASVLFRVPLWRQMLGWLGVRPASRRHFSRLLQDRGAVKVNPGGIAEMYLLDQGAEVIKLRERMGFVRIAVESGAPLLPVYHFGTSAMLRWHAPKCLEGLSRRMRASLGIITGRWGLPLPYKVPLHAVVGPPVPVRQLPRGHPEFDAAVAEAHAAYVDALSGLYHRHRAAYGWGDRPLTIV